MAALRAFLATLRPVLAALRPVLAAGRLLAAICSLLAAFLTWLATGRFFTAFRLGTTSRHFLVACLFQFAAAFDGIIFSSDKCRAKHQNGKYRQ